LTPPGVDYDLNYGGISGRCVVGLITGPHTEGLRLETQAASRWTLQYQAKSVRLHEAQGFSDVVRLVAPAEQGSWAKTLNEKICH